MLSLKGILINLLIFFFFFLFSFFFGAVSFFASAIAQCIYGKCSHLRKTIDALIIGDNF